MNKSIQVLEFIGSSTRQLRMVLVVIKCRGGEEERPWCRRSPARRAGCRRASRRRWEARCCGRAGRRSAATLPAASPAKEETNQPQIQYPNRRKQACNRSRTANICLFFPVSVLGLLVELEWRRKKRTQLCLVLVVLTFTPQEYNQGSQISDSCIKES